MVCFKRKRKIEFNTTAFLTIFGFCIDANQGYLINPVTFMLQMVALATLERCYNNPEVFQKKVKIRKGERIMMITNAKNLDSVKAVIANYIKKVN